MAINQDDVTAFEYWDERPQGEVLSDPDTYITKSLMWQAKHFRDVYGKPCGQPYEYRSDDYFLAKRLIGEEYHEVVEAVEPADLLKELCDLVYVCFQMAATYGWKMDEAMRRVHASNMSKLDDDGQPILRDDGKVQKGPNYQPPTMEDLV